MITSLAAPQRRTRDSISEKLLFVFSDRRQTNVGRRRFTRGLSLSWLQERGRATWASLETRSTVSPGESAVPVAVTTAALSNDRLCYWKPHPQLIFKTRRLIQQMSEEVSLAIVCDL